MTLGIFCMIGLNHMCQWEVVFSEVYLWGCVVENTGVLVCLPSSQQCIK